MSSTEIYTLLFTIPAVFFTMIIAHWDSIKFPRKMLIVLLVIPPVTVVHYFFDPHIVFSWLHFLKVIITSTALFLFGIYFLSPDSEEKKNFMDKILMRNKK